MDPKVQIFLSNAQQAKKDFEQVKKEEKLISLGLCDIEREYGDQYSYKYPYYDSEEKKYYKEKKTAYQVTDEEFAKILEYEKYVKKEEPDQHIDIEAGAEHALRVIAVLALISGCIAAFVRFIMCFINTGYGSDFNWAGMLVVLAILLGSTITWATMKVFANISITLKEINKKFDKNI